MTEQEMAQLLRQLNPVGTGSMDPVLRAMTVGTQASPFGCCNFFDRCTDEILSLHYAGRLRLLDWMGFEVSDVCHKVIEFLTFVRPAYSTGNPTNGYLADPCTDPQGTEWGTAKLTLEDFGDYGRMGPVRKMMQPRFYCATDPRRRLDGTLISDEREWDMRITMDVLLQDIMRHLITGDASVAGQFDGLEQWVNTGYDSSMLDSTVINWNGKDMGGGAGITWNGAAVGATYDIIDVLLEAIRRIRQRIMWSPQLSTQRIGLGDVILLMPSFMVNCLLDFYTCWRVCEGSQYNETVLQTYEARNFRNSLQGGMFGDGFITLDGIVIPIMAYDHELIKGPQTGDMYLLVGAVGSERIWMGEHLNADEAARLHSGQGYFSTDGGRVLGKIDTDNECTRMKLWMHPRLFCKAPWMQVRFERVKCTTIAGPISGDPTASSFYPLSSFAPAVCP